jgi:hypothetical protein
MKLHLPSEVPLDRDGLLCRQSRLMGVVATLVLGGILGGAPVVWWYLEAPAFVWGGCAALAVVVVPMLVHDLLAKFRPANWLMWIGPDGLWINFRSYQNSRLAEAETVVHLEYAEIAGARRYVESYSTPQMHSGSTRWKEQSLELHLAHNETGELQAGLAQERRRRSPERVYIGFIRVTSRASHFPVTCPADDVIRIAWRGGLGNAAVPSLETVLDQVSRHVALAETLRRDRGDWDELNDAELDEQILHLGRTGATISATRLLERRRGYTTTEAHRFVEQLVDRV